MITKERTRLLILVTESTYGSKRINQIHIAPIIIEHTMINKLFLDEIASLYQFHWTVLLEFNACLIE